MSEREGYRRWFRLSARRGADLERELDEEIETHLQMRMDELIRGGATPERARAEAEQRFGGMAVARRRLRSTVRLREERLRRGELLASVKRDVMLGLRQARRSPGYSAIAVLTFALGIGLTTGMYTLVDHVLIRALPYPDPERLVTLMSVDSAGSEFPFVSIGNWVDWQEQNRTLTASALHMQRSFTVGVGEDVRRVTGEMVVGPFFDAIGVPMLVGRAITVEEAQAWAPVAVVGERFWRASMNADRSLEVQVQIDGRPIQVVGVVPDGREYPAGTQLWLASKYGPEPGGMRNNVSWYGVARLREGVSSAQARADLSAIAHAIRASDPAGIYSYGVGTRPLQETVVGDASRSLLLLMGGVVFVLLIACVNLAGLGLARASTRLQEVAVRLAIGAGRLRILRQVATESLVLAVLGGALGVLLAWWSIRAVVAAHAGEIPRAAEVALDARVLAVALLATLAAGLIAGLAPALKVSGVSLRALMGNERGGVRGGRNLPGAALVTCELALALLLLTGGALLVRSFRAVLAQDLGYDARGVITAEVSLASPAYVNDAQARLAYWKRLLERVRAVPGVEAAGVANWIPTGTGGKSFVDIEGVTGGRPGAGYRVVSEDYFRALGVPLLSGRAFETRDVLGGERVALVNRRFVETYWPGIDPVGRRVRASSMEGHIPGGAPWLTVIGVVDDLRHWGHEREVDEEIYVQHRQLPTMVWSMTAVVRSDPARVGSLRETVRSEIAALDRTLAVDVRLLDERVASLLGTRRLVMSLLTGFAGLAVLLSAIGVYGLLSFAVAQRTREIGVRAALGARQSGIVRLMLGSALRVVALGTVLGLIGAFWLTRLMAALLFGITPGDWVSYAVAALILLAVSVVAALVPAWRASRLDPLIALRQS